MPATSNQRIIDGMLASLRAGGKQYSLRQSETPTCSSDFTVSDFAVTCPNKQLIASAAVTGMPAGATLLGVTVGATQAMGSGTTYCMAVAANSAGLSLPVSVLAASTSPTFPTVTPVTGFVILCYSSGGAAEQQCVISQQFKVGG